jgi:hypothetical protein
LPEEGLLAELQIQRVSAAVFGKPQRLPAVRDTEVPSVDSVFESDLRFL